MYLIFDTETTGLPKNWNAPITDTNNWPRVIQIAWQLHDKMGNFIESNNFLISPNGFNIPFDSEKIHGISTELAIKKGIELVKVLNYFNQSLEKTSFVVGQNVSFDINVIASEFHRAKINTKLTDLPILDTCTETTALLCKIPGGRRGRYKLPTLTELHNHLFETNFIEAHNATADVEATTRCFLELIRLKHFTKKQLNVSNEYFENFNKKNPDQFKLLGLKHLNLKKESDKIKQQSREKKEIRIDKIDGLSKLEKVKFAHLHNHSQFSILQSTSQISNLVDKAVKDNMSAVAITDTGNMMGAFYFTEAINKHNSNSETYIKPIVGCEFFVCKNHKNKKQKDNGYQIVLLAKNKNGYHNLIKMSSIAFIDGFYYVPRIDKEIIKKYKKDIIVLTGNLYGEVPNKILNIGESQAEEALLWWKQEFKDDLYIELMRHNQEDEQVTNKTLLKFSKKHNIKIIATNNTFYLDKKDANAHDILLCIKDGEKQSTPIGRGRGYRYGLPNEEYYFKNSKEMKSLFADIPQAITNIQEIVDKIESFTLSRKVLLPAFDIPNEFKNKKDENDNKKRGENNYLQFLTYEGAKKRYKKLSQSIKDRIDFELNIIAKTGYPGYFLIVEDFIRQARKMNVYVGPGRGSAAGSVVAYCLWITNIDPLKYNLLFERFLNPKRITMPDIDIDFDDEGRNLVIDYVIKKYGSNQVAQIITYGTMAAKSSIRDTARVLDLPLYDADRIAKLIPTNSRLEYIFGENEKSKNKINELRTEEKLMVKELRSISNKDDLKAETINKALVLEGSLRNTGTHACGIIITPDDITKFVPVSIAKDSKMYVTQFDNKVVENAGLLKMDFLGLKTLTLIKDTIKIVKNRYNINLDPENFPLDDKETYSLFQKGETVGIFQYESPGMQKHLQSLKPNVFEDLIAMNALYRPGPMEYIPSFINRKHGNEQITYDLPQMEEYLKDTYGITVYQEQVMLLSQKLANFTKGEADILRKAMGKKDISVLKKMKPKFIKQASLNNHNSKTLEKIWKDWEAFASYAFNKSHSTCYAWIAYQTAYLKAHYPAEYMAAVLSNNMNDIKTVSFFMEECKRMGLKVLGPDINESFSKFSVNKNGEIRFGMAAIKGVGSNAVNAIIDEREKNGNYISIFDVTKRVDLRIANKKSLEGLILAGGLDSFKPTHRAQYYRTDEKKVTFIEKAIKFGNKYQENLNSAQISLFEEISNEDMPEPKIPDTQPWGTMELLAKEKEVIGIYISGHPLDDFKNEMKFCNSTIANFKNLNRYENTNLTFGGIITSVQHKIAKNGNGWAIFIIEDYTDNYEFKIFGEEYLKFKHFLIINSFLYIKTQIKQWWTNETKKREPRIIFLNFILLNEVLEKKCNTVTIILPLNKINDNKIKQIQTIIFNNEGKKELRFSVYDNTDNLDFNVVSKKNKINISNNLLTSLEEIDIKYKLS